MIAVGRRPAAVQPERPRRDRPAFVLAATAVGAAMVAGILIVSASVVEPRAVADASAADDDVPGVPLPSSPATGSLDRNDGRDVYRTTLDAGRRFVARLSTPYPLECRLYLYGPETTSVARASPLESAVIDELGYTVPEGRGGTYYLEVRLRTGAGDYRIDHAVVFPLKDVPGSPIPPSPVTGRLSDWVGERDVYSVDLAAGHHFAATLSGDTSTGFYMSLYEPGITSLAATGPVARTHWRSHSIEYPAYLAYVVPPGRQGRHYLTVERFRGGGDYRLDHGTAPDDVPGRSLGPLPATGRLGPSHMSDVYSLPLGASHRLEASVTLGFSLSLYAPGTKNVATAKPLAAVYHDYAWHSRGLRHTVAPGRGGTYYLKVERRPDQPNSTPYRYSWRDYQVDLKTIPLGWASLSPSRIDFGRVRVGKRAWRAVTVKNVGAAALSIDTARLTGWSRSDYSIVSDGASRRTLSPGRSARARVRFAPKRRFRGPLDMRKYAAGFRLRSRWRYGRHGTPAGVYIYSYAQNRGGSGTLRYSTSAGGRWVWRRSSVLSGDRYVLRAYIPISYAPGEAVSWRLRMPRRFRDSETVRGWRPVGGWSLTVQREPDAYVEVVSRDGLSTNTDTVSVFGVGL